MLLFVASRGAPFDSPRSRSPKGFGGGGNRTRGFSACDRVPTCVVRVCVTRRSGSRGQGSRTNYSLVGLLTSTPRDTGRRPAGCQRLIRVAGVRGETGYLLRQPVPSGPRPAESAQPGRTRLPLFWHVSLCPVFYEASGPPRHATSAMTAGESKPIAPMMLTVTRGLGTSRRGPSRGPPLGGGWSPACQTSSSLWPRPTQFSHIRA